MASPQVLVQAPGREMWAAARFNGASRYTIYAVDTGARVSFSYQSAKRKQTIHRRPLPRWARYIAGVNLQLDMTEMPGIDVVVCGNEPPGPRYEHSLGILFGALWYELNLEECSPDKLLEITERVRREYIEGQGK
jgi:hypothetical protein